MNIRSVHRHLQIAALCLLFSPSFTAQPLYGQGHTSRTTSVIVAIAPLRSQITQPVIRRLKFGGDPDMVILPIGRATADELITILRAYAASRQTNTGDASRDALLRVTPASSNSVKMSAKTRARVAKLADSLASAKPRYIAGLGAVKAIQVTLNLPKSRGGPKSP